MLIVGHLYFMLIVCSVLRFQKRFLQSLLGVLVFMEYVTCLKHLTPDYELGFGFFLFGRFKQVSEILGLFLLFAFGLKSLFSSSFSRVLIRDLRGKLKLGELKHGFFSENVLDAKCGLLKFLEEESLDKSNSYSDSARKTETQSDEEYDSVDNKNGESDDENNVDLEYDDKEYDEFNVSKLRKLTKIERNRANVAMLELEKERAASATAAEEAMAMILRLQNEKSLIEMEFNQYRRLAEEERIHDQEVIRSLQWLVWRLDLERSELKLYSRKMDRSIKNDVRDDEFEEVKETTGCLSGCCEDILENVLYSSLDFNL